jgi:hypothetical protein
VWRDLIGGGQVQVSGHWHDFAIPPWDALLLVPDNPDRMGA